MINTNLSFAYQNGRRFLLQLIERCLYMTDDRDGDDHAHVRVYRHAHGWYVHFRDLHVYDHVHV